MAEVALPRMPPHLSWERSLPRSPIVNATLPRPKTPNTTKVVALLAVATFASFTVGSYWSVVYGMRCGLIPSLIAITRIFTLTVEPDSLDTSESS